MWLRLGSRIGKEVCNGPRVLHVQFFSNSHTVGRYRPYEAAQRTGKRENAVVCSYAAETAFRCFAVCIGASWVSPIPDKVGRDQASDEGNLDDARSDRLSDAAAAEEEPDIDGDEEQATNSAIVTAVLAAI